MEEKYAVPQSTFITPSYLILTLIGTLLVGLGSFLFFVPPGESSSILGATAGTLKQYAVHMMIGGSALYLINVIVVSKRKINAKRSGH